MHWYILQVYSGYENKVKVILEERIELGGMQDKFEEIMIPTEEVIELRRGKKRKSDRKFFPGYVLIKVSMDDNIQHLVNKLPYVTGFLGGKRPTPISEQEAESILQRVQDSIDKPKPKTLFDLGELVRIIDGPFVDFNGSVEEVNYEKNRLLVSVSIFGRSTPVELDFAQVDKEK